MDTSKKKVFGDKSMSDLYEEIYNNSKETKGQVMSLIGELKPLVENIGDATLLVPMIKDYLEIKVKNDDALIRLGTIIQRSELAEAKGESSEFDFSDLQDIIQEQENLEKELKEKADAQEDQSDD